MGKLEYDKKPYTYLFYSIIAFILFFMGLHSLLTKRVDEWYIVLIPLIFGIVLLILFLKQKKLR